MKRLKVDNDGDKLIFVKDKIGNVIALIKKVQYGKMEVYTDTGYTAHEENLDD